jgi:hypothetical protein
VALFSVYAYQWLSCIPRGLVLVFQKNAALSFCMMPLPLGVVITPTPLIDSVLVNHNASSNETLAMRKATGEIILVEAVLRVLLGIKILCIGHIAPGEHSANAN